MVLACCCRRCCAQQKKVKQEAERSDHDFFSGFWNCAGPLCLLSLCMLSSGDNFFLACVCFPFLLFICFVDWFPLVTAPHGQASQTSPPSAPHPPQSPREPSPPPSPPQLAAGPGPGSPTGCQSAPTQPSLPLSTPPPNHLITPPTHPPPHHPWRWGRSTDSNFLKFWFFLRFLSY